jgi:hypothetical protein
MEPGTERLVQRVAGGSTPCDVSLIANHRTRRHNSLTEKTVRGTITVINATTIVTGSFIIPVT